MDNLVTLAGHIVTLLYIAFGVIICFWGYKLFKLSVTVAGVLVGYWTGSLVMLLLARYGGFAQTGAGVYIIPLVFALVFGALAFAFYQKAFIVVVAAILTKILIGSAQLAGFLEDTDFKIRLVVYGLCIMVAVIVAVGCFLIQKGAIMFVTAFGGAALIWMAVVKYVFRLTGFVDFFTNLLKKIFDTDIKPSGAIGGLLILGFGIAGFIVQLKHGD